MHGHTLYIYTLVVLRIGRRTMLVSVCGINEIKIDLSKFVFILFLLFYSVVMLYARGALLLCWLVTLGELAPRTEPVGCWVILTHLLWYPQLDECNHLLLQK